MRKIMIYRSLLGTILYTLILVYPAHSQSSTKMTNSDIVALCHAGISDDLVIAKIRAAPTTEFDASIEGLKALQANQISQAMIKAMISPRGDIPSIPESSHVAPKYSHSDDPTEIHAPGLYLYALGGRVANW